MFSAGRALQVRPVGAMRFAVLSFILLVLLLVLAARAEARLTAPEIDAVVAAPPSNAQVPLALTLQDETGVKRTLQAAIASTPAVLILADYACQALCGPVLTLVATSLERSGLQAGKDYRLVVIGLDPRKGPAQAKAMKAAQIGESGPLAAATTLLSADDVTLHQLTTALGYRSVYDAENDQFAHPVVVFVLTADGRVARALSALGIDADDLRLALIEAGEGRIGSTADKIRLLCYGFDPAAGVYTPAVHRLLAFGWLLTAIGLASGIGMIAVKSRRARAS
jgi:protein SCO1/2